jgi:hypothetical protein
MGRRTNGLSDKWAVGLMGRRTIGPSPQILTSLYIMCFTNVNEAGIRYRYFMYSTNKCTDFNKNITNKNKKNQVSLHIPLTTNQIKTKQ